MWIVKEGDFVARASYGADLVFEVITVFGNPKTALLRGVEYRLHADSPVSDLIPISSCQLGNTRNKTLTPAKCTSEMSLRPGRVLHIDGEGAFLERCQEYYRQNEVPSTVICVPEPAQPLRIRKLLEENRPDIAVITGHDGIIGRLKCQRHLANYRSSTYFVEAVKQARLYEPDLDSLVIIAGACQSHFEALMDAGANFASSPQRRLIHWVDPVSIAHNIAYTPFHEVVEIEALLTSTVTGVGGIGGVETKGKARRSLPKIHNS